MIEIKVNGQANTIMEIVRELRSQGLVQGTDFDFSYHQTRYDLENYEATEEQHGLFKFYTERYATLFALKYS